MVDLSVKIGDITLQNPVTPASGAFSWEYNDVIDLNRLGGAGRQDHLPRAAAGQSDAAHGGDRGRHHPVDRAARAKASNISSTTSSRNTRSSSRR